MKFLLALVAILAVVSALPVDSLVYSRLNLTNSVDMLVYFKEPLRIESRLLEGMSKTQRRWAVYENRSALATLSQAGLIEFLKQNDIKFRSHWIDNSVLIYGVSEAAFDRILSIEGVRKIEAVKDIAFVGAEVEEITEGRGDSKRLEYGLEIIDVEAAWATTKGAGVTICTIDTGARYTHEALYQTYRGYNNGNYDHDYNWHDPRDTSRIPFDNNGHGTHVTGTVAGTTGIGVAPEAFWIAAKGCASSSCSNADLTSSFEYALCPTRQDGSEVDCSKGADIISNSWGGGQGSDYYRPWMEACVDAGQVVVFSQGNSGSRCNTANSPGDLDLAIGVGSTDSNDRLSSFSSRGPGIGSGYFPTQKPDLSAPGSSVRSSYYTSDTAYASLSGTSMACPHVSGLAGLVAAVRGGSLENEEARSILTRSCDEGLGVPNGGETSCGGVSYTTYPNYHYGYGRINAASAVNIAKSQ